MTTQTKAAGCEYTAADVQSLADALAVVENVARTLTRALAPEFKVKVRS